MSDRLVKRALSEPKIGASKSDLLKSILISSMSDSITKYPTLASYLSIMLPTHIEVFSLLSEFSINIYGTLEGDTTRVIDI